MWTRSVIILALSLGWTASAGAQFAVEDVFAGAQAAVSAINSGREVAQQAIQLENEARMIKNQIEQLAYAAANLTKSPLQLVNNLQGLMGQYNLLLREAGGIGFQVQGIQGRIGTVYPIFGQPVRDVQDGLRQLQGWMGEIRHASVSAMSSQAVTERLEAQRATLQLALVQSEQAPGELAVIQDSNQILGIIVEQNASLQQLTAASARARTAMDLAQAEAADQALQEAQQRVEGLGRMEDVKSIGIPDFR
jgi:P-type conjugative transfer protein TrbJ